MEVSIGFKIELGGKNITTLQSGCRKKSSDNY
jgi:hypothetical protein